MSTLIMSKLDKKHVANILIDAIYLGDAKACERYGISDRTLRRYKERLASDRELSALVHNKNEEIGKHVVPDCLYAVRAASKYIIDVSMNMDEITKRNPEMLHAVAGAMKISMEAAVTYQYIQAKLRSLNVGHNQQSGATDSVFGQNTDSQSNYAN